MTRWSLPAVIFLAGIAGSPLVAQQPAVPDSPGEVLGHSVGESGWLAEWSQIVDYFDHLAATSPMVAVERIGASVEARPMIMAVITSPANQARLDEIRAGQARLADPRGVPPAEIARLVDTQPAVAFIGASLHGNEIMATQMSMELAHDLVTDPELTAALENVVVLLVPSMNPDGLDITRKWWLDTRGTPAAGSPMPWLYHHYTGHDNNRDFFMVTQPETRAVTRVLYERWFPEVVYDVHQMGSRGSRFFIPPFADPLNPNIDPLLVRETNLIGVQMALDLTAAGKTGVSHVDRYDLWWHGGARTVPARHNMVGILSEAASADYGDPITLTPEQVNQPMIGSLFPERWPGGEWRPRDIVEYELIAAQSLVRLLDRQRESFARNFVTRASRQIALGAEGGPFAYVVPAGQRDPGSAMEMLRTLRGGGVEVHRAAVDFEADGKRFAAGSFVVLLAQPYRAHAKDLLEVQAYPDIRLYPDGPPVPPYDLTGWTLPLQMGVEVVEVERPFAMTGLQRVDTIVAAAGAAGGRGTAVALDPRLNSTHRALHEIFGLGGRVRVTIAATPVVAGDEVWPEGTPIVQGLDDPAARVSRWAANWGVRAHAVEDVPAGPEVRSLRVALYRSWVASADEGWTRWVFEEWGVPYDSLRDDRIRAGGLAGAYDVIVVPDMTYRDMMQGLDGRRSPGEYAGGLGREGAEALRAFVNAGGTLVLLDSSTEFAIRELGVPVREITADLQQQPEAERWYAPGSLLRVEWDTSHPLAAGMPDESAVFYARSPVFEPAPDAIGVTVVGRYPEEDLLLSGYAQGERQVAGGAALVEARVGRGRAIMFGFRPQHRAQTHETFKLLFNSLYRR